MTEVEYNFLKVQYETLQKKRERLRKQILLIDRALADMKRQLDSEKIVNN